MRNIDGEPSINDIFSIDGKRVTGIPVVPGLPTRES